VSAQETITKCYYTSSISPAFQALRVLIQNCIYLGFSQVYRLDSGILQIQRLPSHATSIQKSRKPDVKTKVKSFESIDILLVCRAHLFLSPLNLHKNFCTRHTQPTTLKILNQLYDAACSHILGSSSKLCTDPFQLLSDGIYKRRLLNLVLN
jgi:hypothetical protein